MSNHVSQTTANLVTWLRMEGRSRRGMEADEASWCLRLNEAADEIERLRAERDKYKKGWNDVCERHEALLLQLGGTDA